MQEQEMLDRLKRRDEGALEWFIDRYAPYVAAIVSNIGGAAMTAADVEEASADVFFAFWSSAQKVLPGKEKAYLGGVARNKAKEYVRRRGAQVRLEDDVLLVSKAHVERELELREQTEYVRRAVLAMPHPEREIFLRHYYYYQPVAEIAEELDLNPSTVKTKLHRGRKKLKEALTKGGYFVEAEDF